MAMTGLSIPRKGFQKLITQETIVCRCESLLRCDIENEIETGAATTNAVKSGSRAGMGPCGGKYCQSTIAKIIADRENQSEEKIAPPHLDLLCGLFRHLRFQASLNIQIYKYRNPLRYD